MTNGSPFIFVNGADEVSKLKDRIEKLEVQIIEINKKIETLTKENVELKKEKENAEMEADILRDERQDWESKNDRLEENLSHHTNALNIIREEIKQLKEGKIEADKEIKELKEGRQDDRKEIRQLKEGKIEADREIKELKEGRLEAGRKMERMQERIEDMAVNADMIYIAQVAYIFARQVYYIVLGEDLYEDYDREYYMTHLEGIVRGFEKDNHPNYKSMREKWEEMKVRLKWKPEMADYLKQLREKRVDAAHPIRLYKSKALKAIGELESQNKLEVPICETILEIVRMWQITRKEVPNKLK